MGQVVSFPRTSCRAFAFKRRRGQNVAGCEEFDVRCPDVASERERRLDDQIARVETLLANQRGNASFWRRVTPSNKPLPNGV